MPIRRTKTARELAEKWGVSERSVYRRVAEPRADFLARAKARRDRAVELRAQGLSYAEIAEAMEVSKGTVGRLIHDAKKLAERDAAVDQPQAS
jgi:transposase